MVDGEVMMDSWIDGEVDDSWIDVDVWIKLSTSLFCCCFLI